jgi:hypothetical protein
MARRQPDHDLRVPGADVVGEDGCFRHGACISCRAMAKRALPTWLLVGLALCVLRIPSFIRPLLDDDEAQYAAIAELVRAGGKLYAAGGVDFKFPGIYWTYAAVFALAGRYAMWAVHVVSLAAVLGTAALLARLAGRLATPRAAVLAALFYGVFSTVYYDKMLAANTELFMVLAVTGAVVLLVENRAFAAGALIAVAGLYKQIGLAMLLLALPAPRRVAAAAAGCVAALGAAALLFAATGDFAGLLHWSIERLVRGYGQSAWGAQILGNIANGFLPFLGASIVVWVGAGLALARRPPAWLVAWLGLSLASAAAGGHFFAHYFIGPLAPLAVLAAVELDRRGVGRLVVLGTALPAVVCLGFGFVFEPVTETFGAPDPDYRVPAAWLRAHTEPDDRIFVWGLYPALYVLADRLPASRFVGFMRGAYRDRGAPVASGWDTGPEVWPALAADLAAHPPAVIADTAAAGYQGFAHYPMRDFPTVQELVDRDYVRAAAPGGVVMYVRDPGRSGTDLRKMPP